MPVSLEEAIAEACAYGGDGFIDGFTFENASWAETINVCTDVQPQSMTDESASTRLYTPCGVRHVLPEVGESAPSEITLILDGVGASASALIRAAASLPTPTTVTYRSWLMSDTSFPAMGPISLTLISSNDSLTSITLKAADADMANRIFPRQDYTPRRYPMLFL